MTHFASPTPRELWPLAALSRPITGERFMAVVRSVPHLARELADERERTGVPAELQPPVFHTGVSDGS